MGVWSHTITETQAIIYTNICLDNGHKKSIHYINSFEYIVLLYSKDIFSAVCRGNKKYVDIKVHVRFHRRHILFSKINLCEKFSLLESGIHLKKKKRLPPPPKKKTHKKRKTVLQNLLHFYGNNDENKEVGFILRQEFNFLFKTNWKFCCRRYGLK